MTTIYVQFSDATKTVIVSLFGNPQDPEHYPYQGTVEDSDPRYAVFWNALPENGLC
ncbi:hypothetical protein [Yersinia intermedia]|uniref:hypothetical protein n=1 Tax=Yersinia intermedia TaxID=631 RepID=UPI0038509924